MMQAIHIFRKDVRHQAPVLCMYAVILVLFGIAAPQARQGLWIKNPALPLFVTLLNLLLPLAWFAITVRVVHEEPLVGDRQFWITRPYRWQSLLAAKLFFLALCIWLPFLLMQCIMAMHAGLNPFNTGLLTSAVTILLYIWLPCILLALVFATLPPTFFTAIGTAILWGTVLSFVVGNDEPRTDAPWSFAVLGTIFGLLFFVILIWQYRTRNTRRTRIALVSCVALFLALFMGYIKMPFHAISSALMHAQYPTNRASELHLAYEPATSHSPIEFSQSGIEDKASFTLPLHLQGLAPALRLINLNASYTVEVKGIRYASPWRPVALNSAGINLLIPRNVLRDINSTGFSARFHLDLAGTTLAPSNTQTSIISDSFTIGPRSRCSRIDQPGNHIRCTFAYQVPDPIRIEPITAAGCIQTSIPPSDVRTEDAGIAADPVRVELISLAEGTRCSVVSARAITYRRSKDFSTTIDLPSLWLDGKPH